MRPWTLIILYTSLHGPVARVSAEILVSLRGEQVENMGRSNFGAYMWDPKVSPAYLLEFNIVQAGTGQWDLGTWLSREVT